MNISSLPTSVKAVMEASASQYLVIVCIPCPHLEAEIFLNGQPFKFGTHEHADTYDDAVLIYDDMAIWCKSEHIVIFQRTEVEALLSGSANERAH